MDAPTGERDGYNLSENDISENVERLHKRIAASGICSRRAAETMILEGRVAVNGKQVRELGVKVGPADVVTVDGNELGVAKLHYVIMNKPAGYVTTLADPHAKRTVADLMPDLGVQLKPVGRLDKETEGLLLCTNDGPLALRLTHPRYGVEKEYQVAVAGRLSDQAIKQLTKGVWIEGGRTAPAKVDRPFFDENKNMTFFQLTIHEGRKRQVRQMCLAVGAPVKKLKRVRFGPLVLHKLPKGTCRALGKVEVDALWDAVKAGETSAPTAKALVSKPTPRPSRRPAKTGAAVPVSE